jgi:hypothetical protein
MNVATKIIAAGLVALAMGAVDARAQSQPPADPAPLTPAQVKTVVEGRLIMHRSDLKVGKVTDKDAKTYDVELVKPDGVVQEHALVDKTYARPAGALSPMGHGFGHGGKHGHMGMGGGTGCGQPG